MSDARARFVEAMRPLWIDHRGVCQCLGVEPYKCLVQIAVEAFADAECRGLCSTESSHHATCRAALVKEVMGDE